MYGQLLERMRSAMRLQIRRARAVQDFECAQRPCDQTAVGDNAHPDHAVEAFAHQIDAPVRATQFQRQLWMCGHERGGALGRRAVALPLDVGVSAGFPAFVETLHIALASWDRVDFDALVNNAGMGVHAAFADTTEAQFDALANGHLKGRSS